VPPLGAGARWHSGPFEHEKTRNPPTEPGALSNFWPSVSAWGSVRSVSPRELAQSRGPFSSKSNAHDSFNPDVALLGDFRGVSVDFDPSHTRGQAAP